MAGKNPWVIKNSSTVHLSSLFKLPSILIFSLLLALLVASLAMFSSTSSSRPRAFFPSPPPERSFVHSLQAFLAARAPPRSYIFSSGKAEDPPPFDELTSAKLAQELDIAVCTRDAFDLSSYGLPRPLRVYVYDMPSKFTYDLLWLFHDTYTETANLTSNGSPVHRLIEQHSVDYWLWADLLTEESKRSYKTVVRVLNQAEADIFYIPFFTTISYFLLEKPKRSLLYREAMHWIVSQPPWQRSGGRDHVLPVHHPWSFKSHRRFMKHAIWLLPDMDSTGNWYKPGEVSLEKDIVLPYVPNVEVCNEQCFVLSKVYRSTLLFFRGRTKRNAGGKIRFKLMAVLKDESDVVIEEGTAGDIGRAAAQKGMRSSIFCLSPAGDTPSSARLFDAVVSGCIPVVVSDELELPFEGLLDYRRIVVFVSSLQAIQPGWLVNHLRSMSSAQISDMQTKLAEYSKHFQYSSPAQPLGPEDMTWRVIAAKVPWIKLHVRRSQRLVSGSRSICSCDCRHSSNQTLGLV